MADICLGCLSYMLTSDSRSGPGGPGEGTNAGGNGRDGPLVVGSRRRQWWCSPRTINTMLWDHDGEARKALRIFWLPGIKLAYDNDLGQWRPSSGTWRPMG